MSKPHKRRGTPEFRHFVSPPAPPSEAIEARLIELLTPGTFANLKQVTDKQRHLRERVLTLPVMAAIILSLVSRQVRYLSEIVRILETEGLLWVEAMSVSKQALSQRLMSLPASLFREMFEQLVKRLQEKPNSTLALQNWQQGIHERLSAVWIADGSTLERLQRHLGQLQGQPQNPLAGKMMMVVEVFTHRPVAVWYDSDAQRSEMTWWQELLELLPSRGLLVIDLGFFGFEWFDAMSAAQKYFLTRQKQKVGYKVVKTLSCGRYYRDEIIQMGVHHTHPCRSQVRQVSVLWGITWHRYLTNALDPQMLSPQQVCQLYHCRWQIEDAFLLTKRLLGLASLWVGGRNGVQIQLYATWIFYALLNDLCTEVALALHQPLSQISVEMVFRSLYYYARAKARDAATELIPFLVEHQRSFGLVKQQRKRQRQRMAQALDIWADALT